MRLTILSRFIKQAGRRLGISYNWRPQSLCKCDPCVAFRKFRLRRRATLKAAVGL